MRKNEVSCKKQKKKKIVIKKTKQYLNSILLKDNEGNAQKGLKYNKTKKTFVLKLSKSFLFEIDKNILT